MKPVKISDVSVSSIIEREGPWRAPNIMFPSATAEQLAEVMSLAPNFAYDRAQDLLCITFQPARASGWARFLCPRGQLLAIMLRCSSLPKKLLACTRCCERRVGTLRFAHPTNQRFALSREFR